jgi:hypothetical protein
MADRKTWRPIIFSCPSTGDRVQGLLPGDSSGLESDDLHPLPCAACDGIHLVNLRTGSVIGTRRD